MAGYWSRYFGEALHARMLLAAASAWACSDLRLS
jgi:hypothetical protein